ncbi:DEAD/DEAH box helicase [Salinicola sp. V024]|uniref:DEAD/DEAH box helicase n=1 Tax=Salinicola sp. V024 TaxID=3459609 RepID=UPI004044C6B8
MPLVLKPFQETLCDGLVARFNNLAEQYRHLSNFSEAELKTVREQDAAVVLQAPTGSGKTAIAIEAMARFSSQEQVLWFWFAPFAGLVEQARKTLHAQAPSLRVLDLASDRRPDLANEGGVFVTTWSAVATSNASGRRARNTSDTGLSVDALIGLARQQGIRIGCIVDEAHHGFQRARQAQVFFRDVLKPDYALLMTATPRDTDIAPFQRDTGYRLGDEADWASVARIDAVNAGLLKRGVRVVRFLAKDDDTEQLIDFEQLALRECTETHRLIKKMLANSGTNLTPLMLVQVPNGKAAQETARRHLIDNLGFAEDAIRIHTSDEPDADLISLANDPKVEVLIFKMAVALGFDAPRAFTLAALRGARDPSFGVQVVGRLMRVHALLQGRDDLPEALGYGYVFLANAESQEGLLNAGAQINSLRTQAPEVGTSTTITYSGTQRSVQLTRTGESFALTINPEGDVTRENADGSANEQQSDGSGPPDTNKSWQGMLEFGQAALTQAEQHRRGEKKPPPEGNTNQSLAGLSLSVQETNRQYPRRKDVPAILRGERLPPAPLDLEIRLVGFVDFTAQVLASRERVRTQVRRGETDIFNNGHIAENGSDVWAQLSIAAIAEKARQVVLRLEGVNEREIRERLLDRFKHAIEASGAVPPEDEEVLEQQLDRVLISHPALLREACRRARLAQVHDIEVSIPPVLESEVPLETAERNVYGVFPIGMNEDERRVARLLDQDTRVLWWHRNPVGAHRPDAVGLYRWDEGDGFFPDFIVAIEGRETPDQIALLEIKGAHLWGVGKEAEKAAAEHLDYGRVYMVGRRRGESSYKFLRNLSGRLEEESTFEIPRMAWRS